MCCLTPPPLQVVSLEMLQSAEQQQDMGAGACYNAAVYLLFQDTLHSLGNAAGQSIVQLLQDRVDAGAPVSSEGAVKAWPCCRPTWASSSSASVLPLK